MKTKEPLFLQQQTKNCSFLQSVEHSIRSALDLTAKYYFLETPPQPLSNFYCGSLDCKIYDLVISVEK